MINRIISTRNIILILLTLPTGDFAYMTKLHSVYPKDFDIYRQKALFAINKESIYKKWGRKREIPSILASTFTKKSKCSEFSEIEGFELDLLEQKLRYEELINGTSSYTASMHIIEDFESTFLKETKAASMNNIWHARVLLLLSAALYGTNFTFVKVMNENLPVQDGNILRFLIATAATFPWLFQSMKKDKNRSNIETNGILFIGDLLPIASKRFEVLLAGFEVGCWTGFGYVAQAFGLETTRASTSAFICSLAVVVVPILDLLSGKKPSSRTVIGSLMAVAGVALLELDGLSLESILNQDTCSFCDGDLFSLLQPFAFGLGFWRMEHAMKRYPEEVMKLTAMQLSTTTFLSILTCIMISGFGGLPSWNEIIMWVNDPFILRSILMTGIINTALTVYLETSAMKTLSATETTMLLSTEPIFGSIFANQILGESFGAGGIIGASMILFACIFSNLMMAPKEEEIDK